MKIKSMTAAFGKLDHARLEPGPGLTVIYAPNEGGKSTWCAFWRAMLYGIDTRDRDKKGYLADKNRYQPWSGAPMEGELELEWEGRSVTIRRGPRGNTPFGAFSAVYTGTQEPVPGLTGETCGELLTGAGAEVFARSAFLGGDQLSVTSAPQLERRIAALASSGEEEVSFSQVQGRLKDWLNRRRVNRSVGEIPRLEGELAQVRDTLTQLEEVTARLTDLEGERAKLEDRRDELAAREAAHRLLARRALEERYAAARADCQAAREALSALEAEERDRPLPDREALRRAQGELQYLKVLDEEIRAGESALREAEEAYAQAQRAAQDERFQGLSGPEALERAENDRRACAEAAARAAGQGRRFLSLQIAGLLLGGAAVAAGIFTQLTPLWAGGVCLYLALSLLSALALNQKGRLVRQRETILARWGISDPEELAELARAYAGRCQEADRAAEALKTVRGALSDRQARRENSRTDLMNFVRPFAPEVRDLFGVSAALSRALNREHELTAARDRLEERRRRVDDLAAQGAGREPLPDAPAQAPAGTLEETRRELAAVQARLEELSAQLNQARGRQRAMGDPAALEARRQELEERLGRRQLEYDAIALAMECLEKANARLQERFSPALAKLAGTYLARLTGEKYGELTLTRDFQGSVREAGAVLPHSALYLSRGTADQLYLALRLAICALCLPQKPPIVLDDALLAFDEGRLKLALDLLRELAGEQQLLLFTCRRREEELLAGLPGVTRLEL